MYLVVPAFWVLCGGYYRYPEYVGGGAPLMAFASRDMAEAYVRQLEREVEFGSRPSHLPTPEHPYEADVMEARVDRLFDIVRTVWED